MQSLCLTICTSVSPVWCCALTSWFASGPSGPLMAQAVCADCAAICWKWTARTGPVGQTFTCRREQWISQSKYMPTVNKKNTHCKKGSLVNKALWNHDPEIRDEIDTIKDAAYQSCLVKQRFLLEVRIVRNKRVKACNLSPMYYILSESKESLRRTMRSLCGIQKSRKTKKTRRQKPSAQWWKEE